MKPVELGNVTLNTEVDGPDGAPWIILSNSLGASLRLWDPQMTLLTTTYRVLRYDTRGHGHSSVPPGPYSFDQLTGDIVDMMDKMSIETASFMGLSLGGMTGLGLALEHPNRFDRIICADARADSPDPFRAMWDDRIAKVRAGGVEAIADMTLATWFTADWLAANAAEAKAIREMVVATPQDGYIACCGALKTLDYLRHLGGITIPVQFVGGTEDKGAAPEVMRAMAEATPGGKYSEIPGAAHVANINSPSAFNSVIGSFFGIRVDCP